MTRFILSPPIIRFVLFVERWLLSSVLLFLAYEYISTIQLMELVRHSKAVMPPEMLARDAGFSDGVHFEDYARYSLLAASNLISGILLLIARKPTWTPTRAQQVVIPLAATFSYMVFNQYTSAPAWMTTPLVPAGWVSPLAAVGLLSSIFGAIISLTAIVWLGRSLGIVVSVREVVIGGPYRFVRHPIYLGYLFFFTGLLLTACSFRILILVAATVVMLIWRARLEEGLLCAHSPAYCEWRKVTGFLWPRWKNGRTASVIRAPAAAGEMTVPAGSRL
jgi:protein-S-isoprenylcysteine O-methyltransferase Ste14